MNDITLPPTRRHVVVDDYDTILLITSGIVSASIYHNAYNKIKPPKNYFINVLPGDIFTKFKE